MKFEYDAAVELFVDRLGGDIVNIDEYGFSRQFKFAARGNDYFVEWFHNQTTLTSSGLSVMFNTAEISNTWPSPAGSKLKLQMRDVNKNVVAVIVLEMHKELSK